MRKLDVEADREPAGVACAAVRGLHHAGAAAGDDREAGLSEQPADLARLGVDRVVLPDARGAEDRDRRPVDSLDGLEPFEELLADAFGVADEVAVTALEQASVFHQRSPAVSIVLASRETPASQGRRERS